MTPTPGQPLSEADVSLQVGDRVIAKTDLRKHPDGPIFIAKGDEVQITDQYGINNCIAVVALSDGQTGAWAKSCFDRPHAPVSRPGDGVEGGGEDVEVVHWIREASREITGGNCAFVDDDLAILSHLAKRAVEAGLTDGLSPQVQAALAPPAEPVSRPAGEGEREAVARIIDPSAFLFAPDELPKGSRAQYDAFDKGDRIIALLSPAAPDAVGGEKEALALDQLANAAEVVRRLLHKTKAVQGPSFREAGISFTQAIENARHVLKERDALQPGGER